MDTDSQMNHDAYDDNYIREKIDEAYANPNAAVVEPIETLLPSVISGFSAFYTANGSGYGLQNDGILLGRYIQFWGSQTADVPGSKNTIGIKNPAVDALIDKVIFAKDRADLVAATHALDRVLLWNFYLVPQFTYGFSRYAIWDRFSHAELPKYARSGLPSLWWFDAEKAAKIGKRS